MLYLRTDETFAGCRIESVCGAGGSGVVYLAEDALGRKVALKIVALGDAERELAGIRQYIQAAEGQPNLIRIFHAGIEQHCLYYIMEAADRLEGTGNTYVPKTLAAVLDRTGKLAPPAALELVRSLAGGLQVLHDHGLVHRDIKPENIVFVGGVPKLCDPGLVCTTEATASFVGTLGYLPQECFDGKNLNTPGRDIYALGKVLYVAITGELPAHYPRIPSDLSVTVRRKLWPLMIRVCDSNPKHRFRSAQDLCRAMPQELPMPSRFERRMEDLRQWRLAHPAFGPVLTAALAVLLLAAGIAVHFAQEHQRRTAAYHAWLDGGKMYVLIENRRTPVHLARRLAELLGGRMAEPATEEIRARMLRELAKWQDKSIMLGGVRKYGKWLLHDGGELKMKLELRDQILDSLNLASPGLLNGKFCAIQIGQAFLVEIPL